MSIKLIIFDFDGTLGDTRRNIVTTMQMAIKEIGLPERTEAECASTIGLPLAGCFRMLFPDIQEELIPRCAESYRRIFNENLQKITPEAFPGVVETLKNLKEQGFTLTIASSRSRNSLIELTHNMGIADYISYLIGADDVKEAKPKPEPVLKTLAAMQFEANETLVVGDMAVDIQMGANAGTKTCGVTWGNGSREDLNEAGADYIIDRMEELIDNHSCIDSFMRNGEQVTLIERIKQMEQRYNNALVAIKDGSADSLKAIKEDIAELNKYYGSELWKQDYAADEAGNLPPDLKRGVLSEDGIWNLLSDYREIQKTKQ